MNHQDFEDDAEHTSASDSVPRMDPAAREQLEQTGANGARWFYWVAALSLINTAIAHGGGDSHFILGLSASSIVDGFAMAMAQNHPDQSSLLTGIAIAVSVMISAVVCGFGWLSRKKVLWVFGTGMGLYLLDGLVYLMFGDYMSAGFHVYALLSMFNGFNAYRKLKQADDEEDIDEEEEYAEDAD